MTPDQIEEAAIEAAAKAIRAARTTDSAEIARAAIDAYIAKMPRAWVVRGPSGVIPHLYTPKGARGVAEKASRNIPGISYEAAPIALVPRPEGKT